MKDHIYTTTGVVVGGNLNALLYAHKKNYHIVLNDLVHAAPYDTVGHDAPLAITPYESVVSAAGSLRHNLAMRGLCLFGPKVDSVSVDLAKNEISVSSNFFSPKNMRFSELFVFDATGVSGLPFEVSPPEKYRVLDWFDVRSGATHSLKSIFDEDTDFVKKVTFLDSSRIKGASTRGQKDLIAESLVSSTDLEKIEYSHSLSRMKTIKMMNDAGIRPKKKIDLEISKREIFPMSQAIYIQHKNIVYCDISTEEVINEKFFS